MNYQQLTEGKRYQISVLNAQGIKPASIARIINVNRSTITRELNRNTVNGCYEPDKAHIKALERRKSSVKYKISTNVVLYVEYALGLQWSPEQISAIGKTINYPVSHEWIYRHISSDKNAGGNLYKHLRQGHKRYRRGKNTKRSPIPHAVSIDDRPAIVDTRERLGDWEADTVLGKQGTGVMVTLAERKSRLYLIKRVESKHAAVVKDAIIEMLTPYKKQVHTITFDNGGEFAEHIEIGKALKADMYFAHPYSSWERGLNENFNGLLRQYVPKGTDLRTVSHEVIEDIQTRLNLRPRKCLGFKQPKNVFEKLKKAA